MNPVRGCLLDGVYVPCINRMPGPSVSLLCETDINQSDKTRQGMPGGVIVGDSGLCCSVPVVRVTSIVPSANNNSVDFCLTFV